MNRAFGIKRIASWRVIALAVALALVPVAAQPARGTNDAAGITNAPRTAQSAALSPDLTGLQGVRALTAMIAGGGLGYSVAISGDVVVVGAPDRDAAYVFFKRGSGWTNTGYAAKLTASDNVAGDQFGAAVAISGDTVVVGAPFAEIGGKDVQGAAYVFVRPPTGWAGNLTQTAKLTASDGATGDEFGASVAVSGATVIVGAPFAAIGSKYAQGAAYVFVNTTQAAKLTASDGAAGDAFGASVAIRGDVVLVGAPWHDIGANPDQGAAYAFVKPGGGWANMTQTAKLTASDGATDKFSAELGIAVAISGDTAVAGAWLADVGANLNQGAAYVFIKPGSGWGNMTQTGKLTSSQTDADEFGVSVATDGSTVVVGSPIANGGRGAGYVFVRPGGGWGNMTQNARLTSSDADADGFGASVAISGTTIVVGAPSGNSGNGAGYVFARPGGGWAGGLTQTARLLEQPLPRPRLFLPIVPRRG